MSQPQPGGRFAINYLRGTAIITAGIGLVLLFWPQQILSLFIPSNGEDFFIRFIGSALLGYSTLNYLSSRSTQRRIHEIAMEANIVTLAVATVISIVGVASQTITHFGGLLIAQHVIFLSFFLWVRLVSYKKRQ